MFSSIHHIEDYLQELVPKSSQMRYPAEKGIARTKEFLKLLGSPQNFLKVIHVAGTSGKGSTSFMISKLLVSQGFTVGLHLSPHLIDIRERAEINNKLIEIQRYCSYFAAIVPAIEKMKQSPYGPLTYFEACVGFAYYVFAQEKVQYAVMETGLGGEFDATNIIDRRDKLAVITKIGFDHMKILGSTLREIAHQKAMICTLGGDLITFNQYPSAYQEIKKVVAQKKAHLITIQSSSVTSIKLSQEYSSFSFTNEFFSSQTITIGLLGAHQVQNASLALFTVSRLSKRDGFQINRDSVLSTLKKLRFKGRFDIIRKKQGLIILDGAHNVQKMKALLKTVRTLFPDKKFTFVLAFKKGKEYKKMIQLIIPFAEKMMITDLTYQSTSPEKILRELNSWGFVKGEVCRSIKKITHTIQNNNSDVVVSGSLYLLGDIYKTLENKRMRI